MSVGNFDYLRTSNATVLNKNGVLETVTANNAPISFDASGNFLGLVVEPARTNILLRSEEFNNASWGKTGGGVGSLPVVTANSGVAPDGTATADRVQLALNGGTTLSDSSIISQAVTVSSGATTTKSIYLKSNTASSYDFILYEATTGSGVKITVTPTWQRFTYSNTVPLTVSNLVFGLRNNIGGITGVSNSADVLVWGAQLEVGSNPTSYIKTEASTVTRTVATNFKSGLGDRVGQAEGTIYAQVNTASFNASRTIAALYTDANNELKIGKTNTGAFFASYKVGGTETVNVVNATAARVGNFKLAAAYNSTGMQLFINGANGGSNTAGAVTGFNTVSVGHGQAAVEQFAEPISAFVLFKRRLGTNELTSLTD
jgi:hypothetical protein